MAFKMNRSIIKGTKPHKASIAKARQPVVAQTKMQADPGLVGAGKALGESYVPGAIDYGLDTKTEFKWAKKKKDDENGCEQTTSCVEGYEWSQKACECVEKEVKEDDVRGCMDTNANNYNSSATVDDGSCDYDEPNRDDEDNEDRDDSNEGSNEGSDDSNYTDEAEDLDYTDEDIDADLARIGDGDGGNGQSTEFTNEEWEAEQEREAIRTANELQARLDTESATRAHAASTILPMSQLGLMPTTNTPEMELKKAGPAPEYKKTPKAHDNPDYDVEAQRYDNEGNLISIGGVTNSPGYSYEVESDQWTYNGNPIESYEVPEEFVDSQDEQNEERKNKLRNQNLNSNTPSNEPKEADLIQPQPQYTDTATTDNKEQPVVKEEKPHPNDFEGSFWEKQKQYKEALKLWWKRNNPNTKSPPTQRRVKSEAELRDDKIFKNAVPGGIAQQTMLKNGYKNK